LLDKGCVFVDKYFSRSIQNQSMTLGNKEIIELIEFGFDKSRYLHPLLINLFS
jgi:hypothetical protein